MITAGQTLYNHRYGQLKVLDVKDGVIYVDNGASDVYPHKWFEKDFGKVIHPTAKDAILNNCEYGGFFSKVLPVDASKMAPELFAVVRDVIDADRFIKEEKKAIQKERDELKKQSAREDDKLISKGFVLDISSLDSQIETLLKVREKEEHNPDALSEFSKELRKAVADFKAEKKSIEERGYLLDNREAQIPAKEKFVKEYSRVFDPDYMDISKL